ncbi:MAG: citrate/2-methylcitrate synthase [Oscillospiraceae bacterium]|nr:citrate/2-methylcitrate synthase [Oscillospiraceae bacterium]MDD3261290.1 citrate/2-methylcitrate synthase [Oscillospiraceae bacterium]
MDKQEEKQENGQVFVDKELKTLCDEFREHNNIPLEKFDAYGVKRGLRNPDGTGVLAGLTQISKVHGYLIDDNERVPDKGRLTYRGIDVADIVEGCRKADRFGYEEVVWLLLFGQLPTANQLDKLHRVLSYYRELPENFAEDMILKAPSRNIMNKLARSVLALYSYDDNPDDISLENSIRQSFQLIAQMPAIMTYAYQVKRRRFDKQSMFFHPVNPSQSTAESILDAIRPDRQFTHDEAHLLDLCMILHAEHSGGNNSTFSVRVLSSTGTDIYSAIAAGIGSLKGPKHGGANHRVMMMMNDLMENVDDWGSERKVYDYLVKIANKEVGDHSGLIYGMGHAVYTLSDPRAVILKHEAEKLAPQHEGMQAKFELFELVEKLAPKVFESVHGDTKTISANVDFYSGLVYEMLNIPPELYTPMFAVSRMPGWCAHRIEEIETAKRIMRPAYFSLSKRRPYIPLEER